MQDTLSVAPAFALTMPPGTASRPAYGVESLMDKMDALMEDQEAGRLTQAFYQLDLWGRGKRGMPNEFVRSPLFSARNRKIKREALKNEPLVVLGGGSITYTGEELRQEDQPVWLQLVELAKDAPPSAYVGSVIHFHFTPYAFLRAIGWPTNKLGYARLRQTLERFVPTKIVIDSKRLGRCVHLSMLPVFEIMDHDGPHTQWRVEFPIAMARLFAGDHFSRFEAEMRRRLPDGLASWLFLYFASHREPLPLPLDMAQRGSALVGQPAYAFRRLVNKALVHLVKVGFISVGYIENDRIIVHRRH